MQSIIIGVGLLVGLVVVSGIVSGSRDGARHSKVQRFSRRCIGCEKKILSHTGSRSVRDSLMSPGVRSVSFSGGKISCGECDVDHLEYCVHGTRLDDECEFCPGGLV